MSERLAIYAGSFDPVTNGHLDILRRAIALFDSVIVAVAEDTNKKGLFSTEERVTLLRDAIGAAPAIEVTSFSGLLVEYARKQQAVAIVRGLRAVADFEYEFQLALMNRRIEPSIDTMFLMTDEANFYVSSSLVKEVARLGGQVSTFVPPNVEKAMLEKFKTR